MGWRSIDWEKYFVGPERRLRTEPFSGSGKQESFDLTFPRIIDLHSTHFKRIIIPQNQRSTL